MRLCAHLPTGLTQVAVLAVAGCVAEGAAETEDFSPEYQGLQTIRLSDEIVNFRVAMKGARTREDVAAYARCAAAQYALIRGERYARHVRTNVERRAGVWLGDAVYVISATQPMGLRNIDARVELRDCGEKGIPTV